MYYMKHTYFIFLLFFILPTDTKAQCLYPNGDFETWINDVFVIDENDPNSAYPYLRPEAHISSIRAFILFLGVAFGDAQTIDELTNNGQSAFGFDQSTDAYEGSFASKLEATSTINLADIYTVFQCDEVPDSLSFWVKHIGTNDDTLNILSVFDMGLSAIPEEESELDNFPAYISEQLILNTDTEYINFTVPVNENFDATIDTGYVLFALVTPQEQLDAGELSYLLIDKVEFKGTSTVVDADMDGFNSDVDCDDMNPAINPDAIEIAGNGIDEDCDGMDGAVSTNHLSALEFSLFPNPASHAINIVLKNNLEDHIFKILNLQGKVIIQEHFHGKPIDISSLHSGSYLLQVINRGNGNSGTQIIHKQ